MNRKADCINSMALAKYWCGRVGWAIEEGELRVGKKNRQQRFDALRFDKLFSSRASELSTKTHDLEMKLWNSYHLKFLFLRHREWLCRAPQLLNKRHVSRHTFTHYLPIIVINKIKTYFGFLVAILIQHTKKWFWFDEHSDQKAVVNIVTETNAVGGRHQMNCNCKIRHDTFLLFFLSIHTPSVAVYWVQWKVNQLNLPILIGTLLMYFSLFAVQQGEQ